MSVVESIFLAAVEKPSAGDCAAYLDAACPDPEVRQHVERLLAAHPRVGSFLNGHGLDPTADHHLASEGPGTVIGPYKLLQQIGEGGMGTVFMAEQTRPV